MPNLSQADQEQLSAYLDNELPSDQRAALERRLAADAGLRAELEALREVVLLVRWVPAPRAPRDFRLDPAIYGWAARRPTRARRVYQWSSALSAVAAAILLALGVLGILSSSQYGPGSRLQSQAAPQAADVSLTADGFYAEPGTPVAAFPTFTPLPTQRPLLTQTAIPQTAMSDSVSTGDIQEMVPQADAEESQAAASGARDVPTPLPSAAAVEAAAAIDEAPSEVEAAANAAEGMLTDQDTPLPLIPTMTAPEPGGAPPDAFVAPPLQPETGATSGTGSGGIGKPPSPAPGPAMGLGGGVEPTSTAGLLMSTPLSSPLPSSAADAPAAPLSTATATATAMTAAGEAGATPGADDAAVATVTDTSHHMAERQAATDAFWQSVAATATAQVEAAVAQAPLDAVPFTPDPRLLVGGSLALLALAVTFYVLAKR